MSQNGNTITAEDLYQIELISGPQLSPDGSKFIYALHRVDQKTEKKYSNLWIVDTADGSSRQFTSGDQSDANPKWSPDGKTIAFTSNRSSETQPQIYLIGIDGGEAQVLTDLKGTIASYNWSPDGKSLVMQFRKMDPEAIEREEDEVKKKLGVVSRHYDRIFYKYDGQGYLPKEQFHIWTVDATTGEAQQLTDDPVYSELEPVWTPDGESIVFRSNRQPDPDMDHQNFDIFVIPRSGGDMRELNTPAGMKALLSISPDGKWAAFVGPRDKNAWYMNANLWITPIDGSGPAKNLTGEIDLNCSTSVLTDVDNGAGASVPPIWSLDSEKIYFGSMEHGSNQLKVYDLGSGTVEDVINHEGALGMYNFDNTFTKLGYFEATMMDPGQLYVREMESGKTTQLTHFNKDLFKAKDLGSFEEIWFKGPDGNDLQGWILKPPGFDPEQQYPSILEIHGGPLAQYGHFFMHEFYFLAAKGYVVYFTNPRGGRGYGEEHSKAIWGGWGDRDYADTMAFVDRIEQEPYIDKERMGVTGGSYGGYMSLWIIGHTDRFEAVVAQRVVSNLVSMWGSSDMNYVFQQVFGDKAPFEDMDKLWHHSPMKYIGNATTPTLIIHSENDFRCPIEQGEQAFVALKRLGIDSEMVRFPEEPHGVSRVGRTDRRVVRLNHIVRWMDKYLK